MKQDDDILCGILSSFLGREEKNMSTDPDRWLLTKYIFYAYAAASDSLAVNSFTWYSCPEYEGQKKSKNI